MLTLLCFAVHIFSTLIDIIRILIDEHMHTDCVKGQTQNTMLQYCATHQFPSIISGNELNIIANIENINCLVSIKKQ